MEPATLYIMFILADGIERVHTRNFWSVDECERYVAAQGAAVRLHACVRNDLMPPQWFTERTAIKKDLKGVPLDPKYRP